jgi:secretion/DNA translocation related TadE-like protein
VRSEGGSITVVAAAVIAIGVVATMGVADVGKALLARAHAQQAADAAALAAAQELALPTGRDPAEVAADLAARNGAELTACACAAGTTDAVVDVLVPVGPLLLVPGALNASARARAVVDLLGRT